MVMVTDEGSPRGSGAHTHEFGEEADEGDTATLHERLVAYVLALDSSNDCRSGVWSEHSYARARSSACAGAVRVLLAPRDPAPPPTHLDVETLDREPPAPPDGDPVDPPFGSDSDSADDDADDDWEARVLSGAPGAEHTKLAASTVEMLRRVRLARLVRGRTGERAALRAEAARLRRALAPLWLRVAASASTGAQVPSWLHATLEAHAPPTARRSWARLVGELRRAAPRLAERLTGASLRVPPAPMPALVGRSAPSPWLAWVGGGRWPQAMGVRLYTRALGSGGAPTAAPDSWCAAVAGSVRAAFVEFLAEAGDRAVVVGGCGWGASVVRALLREGTSGGAGHIRGALLLGPALRSAEPVRAPPPSNSDVPALWVSGTRAPHAGRERTCALLASAPAAEAKGANTRVLLVAGADDQLRLPAHVLRRKRLTQPALDAAIVEECVRWVQEVCEAPEPRINAEDDAFISIIGADSSEEEYLHLPHAVSTPPTPTLASGIHRSIEIVEGRVVSRGAGGTPVTLLPPRRVTAPIPATIPAPISAPAPLAAADIMDMPIVFADDEPEAPTPPPGDVTVTSGGGALKYTRVIVASRGGAAGGARPLMLRRGVRVMPRNK